MIVNLRNVVDPHVRIDRQTKWGNPFVTGKHGSREEVIELYREQLWKWIKGGHVQLEELAELRNKQLACWCAPLPCHGEVLERAAEWAWNTLNNPHH